MKSPTFWSLISKFALLTSAILAPSDGWPLDPTLPENYGHLVSLYKPVSIDPPQATCTQGHVTLSRKHMSPDYQGPNITYHCTASCSRIFPVQHHTLYQAIAEEEVIYLGDSNCSSTREHSFNPNKRDAECNNTMYKTSMLVDTRPVGQVQTFMLDVYAESNGTILSVQGVFQLQHQEGQLFIVVEGSRSSGIIFPKYEWTRLAIQFKRSRLVSSVVITLLTGKSRDAQLYTFDPNTNLQENNGDVYLGLRPLTSSDRVFRGRVRNVKIYRELLTNREILAAINNEDIRPLSPKSECLCPESYPRALDTGHDLNVYCASNDQPDDVVPRHVHNDMGRLFLPGYLTDGMIENHKVNDHDGQHFTPGGIRMWASNPGASTFSITVHLRDRIAVSRVGLYGMTFYSSAVYTLQSYNEKGWEDVHYFTSNHDQCPSHAMCTIVRSTNIEWDVPDFVMNSRNSSVTTNELRFQVAGNLASTQDFYLFTEFMVFGVDFCTCFVPGTVPGTTCDPQGRCVCNEEMDKDYTSPRCEPYMYSIVPTYGPNSGNTLVKLQGQFFVPEGTKPRVYLQDHGVCTVSAWTNNSIKCSTPDRTSGDRQFPIIVFNGERNITTNFTFLYRPDPIILTISPASSILSGGIVQTVKGKHLDVLYSPQLIGRVIYNQGNGADKSDFARFSFNCSGVNSTTLLCIAPLIPCRKSLQTLWSSSHITNTAVSSKLVGFKIQYLRDGPNDYQFRPAEAVSLEIYHNPEFVKFGEPNQVRLFRTYSPHNHRHLEVRGRRLEACCLDTDFHITVGGEICEIYYRNATTIYCYPPLEEPKDYEGVHGAAPVVASVGFITTTVGYLDYESGLEDSKEFKIGLSVALLLLLIVCLIVCTTYRCVGKLRRKRLDFERRKSFQHLNTLQRKDPMLLTLISDRLRSRLEGSLIDIDQLEMDREIGKGNFGVVYKGVLRRGGEVTDVAVKTIKKANIGFLDIEEFLQEATATRGFVHPNVLTIIGVSIDRRDCYVVLPFMEKGNLLEFLRDVNNSFNVAELVRLGLQAAKGMEYLESQNFLHRDLAARNCMVDANDVVKIADFGLSRDLYQGVYYKAKTKSRPLPVKWMAIECLANNAVFTTKSDVWSFGVLLWEIITRGVVPYSHVDPKQQLQYLRHGGRLGQPQLCPDDLYQLMCSCWEMKPKDRPSFKEVVDYITHLVVHGSGSNTGNEYIITGDSNPGRGACCTPEMKSQVPPKKVVLRPVDNICNTRRRNDVTRPADAVANVSMRNAVTPSKTNKNPRRCQDNEPAIEETSFTTPYENLHHKSAVQKPSDNGCSKEHAYTCLSESPSYANVWQTSTEGNEEACLTDAFPNTSAVSETSGAQGSDSPTYGNLLKPEGLRYVTAAVGTDHGDLCQTGEQESGAEQADSAYCDMSGFLAVVESPMNTDNYDYTL